LEKFQNLKQEPGHSGFRKRIEEHMAVKESVKESGVDLNQVVNITAGDLLQLFAKIQQDQSKASEAQAKVLAEAFAESRKPYVDPGQAENLENARKQMRAQQVGLLRKQKLTQKMCEHEQGQTGDERNGKSAFHFLKLPTGEWIGICSYCQKTISSVDPRDAKFFQKKSGRPAEAGQFMLTDPIEAQLARRSPDERAAILKARAEAPKPVINDIDEE
jgi:hypothetical protein